MRDADVTRDIDLARQAQALRGVTVTGAAASPVPPKMAAFFERKQLGIGSFLDRAMLAKFDDGGRTSGPGGRREARLLHGRLPRRNRRLPGGTGIEVYAGPAQVPAQYHRPENLCGVMLIWTRIS